jgi:hypothetical protein
MVNATTSHNEGSYKPRPDAPGYNSAAAQRVIQMVPAQVDPISDTPYHGTTQVLHHADLQKIQFLSYTLHRKSYPRKKQQEALNVPACIST